ncbi:hypothetical protein [Streptomyces sp. NPDC050564]|uniref:hypothetical protein n=1 Tax=Streptomyces sp. NPDC050564 TaxID=3365631 RepID=UPI0037908D97
MPSSPPRRPAPRSAHLRRAVPGDTNGVGDAFVRGLRMGRVERVSVVTGGAHADRGSTAVAVSAVGRYVVFVSTATNLVARPEPQADWRLRRTS